MNTSQYLSLFLQEMRDNCAGLSQKLVLLEKRPEDAALINDIMRLSHSCKGAAATMGFEKTAELCHVMEDLFDAVRHGTLAASAAVIDASLRAVGALDACLDRVEKDGTETAEYPMLAELRAVHAGTAHVLSPPAQAGAQADMADTLGEMERLNQVPHIRVESRKLDTLLELAGELSILRLQFSALARDPTLKPVLSPVVDRFTRLTDDLTYHITQSRLIPLDQVFARFPRLVRDLARSQGKLVDFVMEGTGVELDKTLIDHLITPLIHLLRNAVDHGIEPAADRKRAGKPEQGTVVIRVRREQGYAVIDVEDDGAAIDVETIRRIARERGFSAEEVARIAPDTVLDFLCNARFSSTRHVSMVSGRGVGLSAVRSVAKELGGQLQLEQEEARKRFVLRLPLQLSVIRSILVNVRGTTYGLPFVHIRRLLHVSPSDVRYSLGSETLVIDGEDVPLVRLRGVFHNAGEESAEDVLHILLTETGEGAVALCVDEVLGNEEVMVKPASDAVRAARFFSGYTVLGDGRVALIIDVPSLVRLKRPSPA